MPAANFGSLKALVIEDNKHMRALLRSLLKALGMHHISEAADGNEGLMQLDAMMPDFILSDLNMRPMNGLEFTRRVRSGASHCRHIPIVMVTGHTERRYIEAARDAGVTEILAKPVTPQNLYIRLAEIVERPRPFVRCDGFFGPDRRRRIPPNYRGPRRRGDDGGTTVEIS